MADDPKSNDETGAKSGQDDSAANDAEGRVEGAENQPASSRRGEPESRSVKRPGATGAGRTSVDRNRRVRASGESAGFIGLVAAGLVIGNLALAGVVVPGVTRFDATRDEKYTISKKGTAHLLSTLKKPLHIKVYAPEGLATIDAFVRDLRDLLEEYKRYGSGKVSYEIIVPDRLDAEQKAKAEAEASDSGLKKTILGENKSGGQATIGQGFLGMVLTYGGERAVLDQQDGFDEHNGQGLEFLISNKLRELRDREDNIVHRIGWLTGHKERGFQEISGVFNRYFPYYKLEQIDLSKGEKAVDEALDGLILTTPEEELASKELRRIDEFLMKGKTLAVFANNLHIKEADTSMTGTFAGHGLDKLLAGYGIDFKNELVADAQQFWTPTFRGPAGLGFAMDPYPLVFVSEPRMATFDNKFAPFFRMQQLAVPFPVEMTVDQGRAGGDQVKVDHVLRTSNKILTVQGTSISLKPSTLGQGVTAQKSENRQATLGVSLEGPLKSAFPTPGDGISGVPAQAVANARLFVLSSAYYLTNPFTDASKPSFNIPGMDPNMGADEELARLGQSYQALRVTSLLVAKATCDWISQETDLLAVAAKMQLDPELTYQNVHAPQPSVDEKIDSESYRKKQIAHREAIKAEQSFTQYFNIIAAPLALALYGLFRWSNRNQRRAAVKI